MMPLLLLPLLLLLLIPPRLASAAPPPLPFLPPLVASVPMRSKLFIWFKL